MPMTDEPSRTETAPSKGRTYTLVGVMGVLALAFALQFPAMSRWQQAQAAAEEIYGTEEDHIPLKFMKAIGQTPMVKDCLLYTSPSPRDKRQSRMPSSA